MDASKRLRVLNRAAVTAEQLLDNERGPDALLYILRVLRKSKIDSKSTERVQLAECARLASRAVICILMNLLDATLAPDQVDVIRQCMTLNTHLLFSEIRKWFREENDEAIYCYYLGMISRTILRDEALATDCLSSWREKDRKVKLIMDFVFSLKDGSIRPDKALTKSLRKILNQTLMEIGTPRDKDMCPRILEGLTIARVVCASCSETRKASEAEDSARFGSLWSCSWCRRVAYCSKECQRDHWSEHKSSCVMRAERQNIDPC
jgi:hypothetical protein